MYFRCDSGRPPKYHAPLIIDPNRMEPFPFASQYLQAVARWHAQIAESRRVVQIEQLASCCTIQLLRESPDHLRASVGEQVFSQAIPEGLDHVTMLSEVDNNRKRGIYGTLGGPRALWKCG